MEQLAMEFRIDCVCSVFANRVNSWHGADSMVNTTQYLVWT